MRTPTALVIGALIGLSAGYFTPSLFSRYRLEMGSMGSESLHIPVFIKFDRFTGQAWICQGNSRSWESVQDERAQASTHLSVPDWAKQPLHTDEFGGIEVKNEH